MALSISDQLDIMRNSLSRGDFDLLVRAIKNPNLITPEESRTVGESLGFGQGMVRWMTNVATDPTVWIAAILSRRYAPSMWRRGIPHRFTGEANAMTGFGKWFKPVAKRFRGKGIEEMLALGMYRVGYVNRIANPMRDSRAALNEAEKIAVMRFKEEGVTAGMTANAHRAERDITSFMVQMWEKLSTTMDVRGGTGLPGAVSSIEYGAFREAGGKLVERPLMPRSFASHIPHMGILSTEGTMTLSGAEALRRMAKRGGKELHQALTADSLKITRQRLKDGTEVVTQIGPWRIGQGDVIQTSVADWKKMMSGETGKFFFGNLEKRTRDVALFSKTGQKSFVLDLDHIMEEYVRGASRTYAWNSPIGMKERIRARFPVEKPNPTQRGAGGLFDDAFVFQNLTEEPLIVQMQKAGLNAMGVKMDTKVLRGTENWTRPIKRTSFRMPDSALDIQALDHLISSVKGSLGTEHVLGGMAFSHIAGAVQSMMKNATPGLEAKLATHFEYLKTRGTSTAVNNFITSWTYFSTLGLNASSTIGNSMQTGLSTMPAVGIGATLGGVADFAGRLPQFAGEAIRALRSQPPTIKGIDRFRNAKKIAWQKTFPEMANFKMDVDPRFMDIDESSFFQNNPLTNKLASAEKYMQWVMIPFTAVENANRAVAFFSARRQALQMFKTNPAVIPRELRGPAGEIGKEAMDYLNLHSAMTVNATQFLPGGGTRTIVQDMVAPWLRQFTGFPVRLLSFMGESTVNGALTAAEMKTAGFLERATGGRNLGTLARVYLGADIAGRGMRDVLGIDINRWVGFGPLEPGGANSLGPLPIPPVAGSIINVAKAIAGREWDRTQPLELPGIGKAFIPKTMVPGGVAMSRLARAIEQFDPDAGGFVDEDRRLMRRGDTTDFVLAALGIPTNKARRERQWIAQIGVRKQAIRDSRRKYAQALIQGNLPLAAKRKKNYAKMFPDLPPLNVAAEDLRTYAINGRVPRLARALKSIGNQHPHLTQQIIEIDPAFIAPIGALPQDLPGR